MKRKLAQICGVLMLLLIVVTTVYALSVTTHNVDGTLVEGLNRLSGGDEFLVPATTTGARYLINNETGLVVKIIPPAASQAIGSLPSGHQALVANSEKLDLIETETGNFLLWQGAITDGGDYYPPAASQISLAPSALVHGSLLIGNSSDQQLTISNVGASDLILGTLGAVDMLTVPFSLPTASDNCSGVTLPPAGSCTVAVRFAPLSTGAFADSFDVPSNDPINPEVSVTVSGSGVAGSGIIGTDFSEYGLGSGIPAQWTERWATGSAFYTIVDSLTFPGQKELNVYASTGARRLISYDPADGLGADVEQLMLFKDPVNEGSIHTDFRLYARASGTLGNDSAYYFTTDNNQGSIGIYKNVNGALTPLGEGDEEVPFNSTDSWWVRFRVEGAQLSVKLWPYGSVEPIEWQLSYADTSVTAAGWQGLGNYWIGDHIFQEYSVAKLPDAAKPVTGFGISAVPAGLINLNAETGDTRGWTNEYGELRVNQSVVLARSGQAHFLGGGGDYRAYQRIDLNQIGVTPSHLAQGTVVSFRAWQRALSYGDDSGRIGLRILDASSNEIGSYFTTWDYKNSSYVPKSVIETLPVNAAYVDIILEGQLVRGSASSAYFDDLEVGIAVKQ